MTVCAREGCEVEFVATTYNRRFCSTNCRKREWSQTIGRANCVSCGVQLGEDSAFKNHTHCMPCRQAEAERKRAIILEGYRAGRTAYEIAAELGISVASVATEACRMRHAGVEVPYGPLGAAAHRHNRGVA